MYCQDQPVSTFDFIGRKYMNVLDAAYNTVHDYPGGTDALALRVGISSGQMLRNKVNENQTLNHLTLHEAAKIVGITQDKRIPEAMAAQVGCVLVKTADFDGISDMALLESYTKLLAELGDFSKDFHAMLADGRITPKEITTLEKQMRDVQSAGAELLNRARQLAEPVKD
jgi:hypothetical protein